MNPLFAPLELSRYAKTLTTSDATHEMHIQYLGKRMEMAMAAGNRQEAMDWMQAQTLAIDEGVNYFAACGSRDGAQLKAEARHA
jgi:hypothetical protein